MIKAFRSVAVLFAVGILTFGLDQGTESFAAESARSGARATEAYVDVPMPPGFQVIVNEEIRVPKF